MSEFAGSQMEPCIQVWQAIALESSPSASAAPSTVPPQHQRTAPNSEKIDRPLSMCAPRASSQLGGELERPPETCRLSYGPSGRIDMPPLGSHGSQADAWNSVPAWRALWPSKVARPREAR